MNRVQFLETFGAKSEGLFWKRIEEDFITPLRNHLKSLGFNGELIYDDEKPNYTLWCVSLDTEIDFSLRIEITGQYNSTRRPVVKVPDRYEYWYAMKETSICYVSVGKRLGEYNMLPALNLEEDGFNSYSDWLSRVYEDLVAFCKTRLTLVDRNIQQFTDTAKTYHRDYLNNKALLKTLQDKPSHDPEYDQRLQTVPRNQIDIAKNSWLHMQSEIRKQQRFRALMIDIAEKLSN